MGSPAARLDMGRLQQRAAVGSLVSLQKRERGCIPNCQQWYYLIRLRAHARRWQATISLAKGGGAATAVLGCASSRPPSYRARPSTSPSVSRAASPPSSRSAWANITSIQPWTEQLGNEAGALLAPRLAAAVAALATWKASIALPAPFLAQHSATPMRLPTCQRVGVCLPVGRGGKQPSVGVEPSRHHALQKLLHQAAHVNACLLHSTA